MKKLILFLLLALPALAQTQPQIQGAGAPTNPCMNGGQQYVDTTNKVIYNCSVPGSNWVNIGLGNQTGGGGGGTPGSPSGSVQYNNGGSFAGDSALSTSGAGSLTDTQGTITADAPVISNTATLNAGAVAFHGFQQNWTCTAAASGTQALALGAGGTQFTAGYSGTNCATPLFKVTSTNPAAVMSGALGPGNANGAYFGFPTQTSGLFNDNGSNGSLALYTTNVVRFRMDSGGNLINAAATNFFRGANSCYVTAAIPGGATANICSWSLPAIAYTWAYKCDVLWQVSAGTSPTFSLGINASQTPTSETAMANILTTNANVGTEGSVTATASGNQNILTTGTLTPSATNFQAQVSGTVQASGTAGTFAVTFTLGGSGLTGQVSPGSNCILY